MDTYLTFDKFKELGGREDVTEATFNRLEYKARITIDEADVNRILGKMQEIPEAVIRCMVELINLYSQYDWTTGEPRVKSFSNDGVSESYELLDAKQFKTMSGDIIRTYLMNVTWQGIRLLNPAVRFRQRFETPPFNWGE